jgi:hypothetical protein
MKKIEKFVCLLGLPRSGTTIATAIIDAHSAVEMFYEPWNSSRKSPPPIFENPLDFIKTMREKFGSRPRPDVSAVGFKETATHYKSLEWSKLTLEAMNKHCQCQLIIVIREPIHAYLSKIEGAKKYWGHHDFTATEDRYKDFVRQAMDAYDFMNRLSSIYNTIIFDYDALILSPEYVVTKIMNFMNLKFENEQLNYNDAIQLAKIMGDPEFISKCQKGIGISEESIILRRKQSEEFKKKLRSEFWNHPEVQSFDSWIQGIKNKKVVIL